MALDVAIIGAGIGGLTTAIALEQRGIAARIFEAAPELREAGAGIWLPPNAMQVLERLDLADAVEEAGLPVTQMEVRDFRAGLLQATDLSTLKARYGFGITAIHRARLQQILASRLPPGTLILGHRCRSVTLGAADATVDFEAGAPVKVDLVIGADGVHSTVRQTLFPEVTLRYSGQTSFRGVARVTEAHRRNRRGSEIWGIGRRFGYSWISPADVYWYCTWDATENQPSLNPTALARELARDFPDPIPAYVAATTPGALLRTDLSDFLPMPSWHRGSVVLLGDAAHAATPNLGQGGAQAIEDAYVLAQQLSSHQSPEGAFRAYEQIRGPKASMITRRSWQWGKLAHLGKPAPRALRNLALRLMPMSLANRQLESIYALNY